MIINCYGIDCSGWKLIHRAASFDMLGYVPAFLLDDDPRPAREQFQERYVYGGWRPIKGFTKDAADGLHYPEDPVLPAVAYRMLRQERIVMYPGAVFAIIQPDGSWDVARLD